MEGRSTREAEATLDGWAGDGVIARVSSAAVAERLAALKVPVVNVSAIQVPEAVFPRVATDVEAAGQMAAEYFLRRGFRSFGYVSVIGQDYVARQRKAFAAALAEVGHAVAELSLTGPDGLKARELEAWRRGTLEGWLKERPKPVAVFGWSGGSDVVEACRATGLAMPEEVAMLSGSNDDVLCEVCDVPISAVRQPAEQIGAEAAGLLARLMNGAAEPRAARWIAPTEIVTRRSTDTLAVDDAALVAALRYIRENAARAAGVEDVAAAAGVSRRVLERRFAERLGTSPAEHLRRERMARAQALLTGTSLPVPAVAEAAGFGSPEYLAQCFREEHGVSPLRYRRRAWGG